MSDNTIRFELVCPEGMVMDKQVEHVLIPGMMGDFMVLPEHAPVISTLRPGILEVALADGEGEKRYYVNAGFAEVNPTSLTILAQQAIDADSIEKDYFENEIKNIEQELEDSTDENKKDMLISKLDTIRTISQTLAG